MASDFGTGTTIAVTGNAALVTWVAALEVVNIEFSDIYSREAVDFTHMETTVARAYRPTDLYDPGTMNVTVQFDPALVMSPLTTTDTLAWTISFAGQSETLVCNGFITNYGMAVAVEEKMQQTFSVKLTGAISGTMV